MFLVSTRNFPPEVGGMQNLMEGLSNSLLNHGPVKVFADGIDNSDFMINILSWVLKGCMDLKYLENIERPIW